MTGVQWLRFPARWGEFAASRDVDARYWMPKAHLAFPDESGHRALCWKTTFAGNPTIQGGMPDDEYDKCGKCARMETKQ